LQAGKARASEEMMQHCLDLVVGRVGHGHVRAICGGGGALKKPVAHVAGGLFEIQAPLARIGRHVRRFERQRNVQALAQVGRPSGIVRGSGAADSVIEVRRDELQSLLLGEGIQAIQQGHAVASPGDTDQNSPAA
jgi:hypothetical protein